MGRQAGPSPEELEFIFGCFLRGLSDREVLDEMEDTEFPLRNPRFMRDRRREFNAAKKVLRDQIGKEVDPLIAKSKEEHLTEVRSLMEQWLEVMKTPQIHDVTLETPCPFEILQANPLFECLREHLPFRSLWLNYYLWTDKTTHYLDSCQSLIREIIEDEMAINLMNESPTLDDDSFYRPVLECVNDKALGKEPAVLSARPPEPEEEVKVKRIRRVTGRIERIDVIDIELCTRFLDSKVASNVIVLFREVKALETKIRVPLQEMLLRRDYVMHTCRLCPGQAGVSP